MSDSIRKYIQNTIFTDDSVRNEGKSFRSRLREICSSSRKYILDLLDTEVRAWPAVEAHNKLREVEVPDEPEEFDDLIQRNKHVLQLYIEEMNTMFEAYEELETKIDKLSELENEFFALSCLDDDSDAAKELVEQIDKYIQKRYDSCNIIEDFRKFSTSHKKWRKYREVVLSTHAAAGNSCGNTCSICTSERLSVALMPCGHTFCSSCAGKQKKHCFICRGAVEGQLRIFFS